MVADGILGLTSIDYGAGRDWPYWLALTRGALAILAGLGIIFIPQLQAFVDVTVVVTLVGAQAVIVGILEALLALRGHGRTGSVWVQTAAGLLYVAVGVVLVLVPIAAVRLLMQVGGVLLIAYALILLVRAWEAMRLLGRAPEDSLALPRDAAHRTSPEQPGSTSKGGSHV